MSLFARLAAIMLSGDSNSVVIPEEKRFHILSGVEYRPRKFKRKKVRNFFTYYYEVKPKKTRKLVLKKTRARVRYA